MSKRACYAITVSIYDDLDIPPPKVPKSDKPDSYGVASRGAGKPYQIRNTEIVNKHVAHMVVNYGMDYEAAIHKMLPLDASEVHIRMLAQTIEQRPGVKRYIQEILGEMGFTAAAERMFMAKLSEVAMDKNHKQWSSAIKIIGEYYGWSKKADESDKPVTLVFKGFEDDVKRMFDGNLPDTTPAKSRPAILEDEESVQ